MIELENKKYDVQCPECGKKFWVKPSLFHMMGAFNLGGGSCPSCKLHLNICYLPDEGKMKLRPFDEFYKELQEKTARRKGDRDAEN